MFTIFEILILIFEKDSGVFILNMVKLKTFLYHTPNVRWGEGEGVLDPICEKCLHFYFPSNVQNIHAMCVKT